MPILWNRHYGVCRLCRSVVTISCRNGLPMQMIRKTSIVIFLICMDFIRAIRLLLLKVLCCFRLHVIRCFSVVIWLLAGVLVGRLISGHVCSMVIMRTVSYEICFACCLVMINKGNTLRDVLIPTFLMLIHLSRLMVISVIRRELPRCFCKVTMEQFICCRPYLKSGVRVL